jgi:hypothetical protein
MMLSAEEKRLLHLYRCGSATETAAVIQEALTDISEPEVHAAAKELLRKLENINGVMFCMFAFEAEGLYGD